MKSTLSNDLTVDITRQIQVDKTNESLVKENENEPILNITDNTKKLRAPIGLLPAYIPIN